jgi:hypothetical protein
MPNFSYVAFSDNFFYGTLPLKDGLCEGGSLQHLAVNNNSFEGAIPLSLASCASLIRIRMDDNLFTSIPDGFGRNSTLEVILAGRNQLTDLGVNSQLTILDLSFDPGKPHQLARPLSSGQQSHTAGSEHLLGLCHYTNQPQPRGEPVEWPHRNRDWVAENIAGPQLELWGIHGTRSIRAGAAGAAGGAGPLTQQPHR